VSGPESPTITVVTVCRNVLPALRETVASVLSQDYPALEYWIVDGASTDGTVEYLAELERRGVRTVSEPDRGISDAMNKGIRLASGTLIAHLHAGDLYAPGALEAVAHAHAADPGADVYCAWMRKREPHGDVVYRCAPDRLERDMTVNHPATWTRREAFERLGGFDEGLKRAMDYDFFLRARVAGCRFHVIEAPLAIMESGGASERSLWATLAETHAIRRRRMRAGFARTGAYLAFLYARGEARRALQAIGLGGLVAWYRRRFALLKKHPNA
jgi:glycosyltransferase involved in cell wall biosynthesis